VEKAVSCCLLRLLWCTRTYVCSAHSTPPCVAPFRNVDGRPLLFSISPLVPIASLALETHNCRWFALQYTQIISLVMIAPRFDPPPPTHRGEQDVLRSLLLGRTRRSQTGAACSAVDVHSLRSIAFAHLHRLAVAKAASLSAALHTTICCLFISPCRSSLHGEGGEGERRRLRPPAVRRREKKL
jgi:hypothetical protein